MINQQIIISKSFTFEASHVLPKHPGKCSRLHGHSWKLTVSVIGEVDVGTGFVCDYADLARVVRELVVDKVDHQHLGCGSVNYFSDLPASGDEAPDFEGVYGPVFYPSSENLVCKFAEILRRPIQELNCELYEVALEETCTSKAVWRKK